MGDFNAKKLLAENSKLKSEQKELSSVLGEEKEMVKYLHGVIKNYEQLLRSDSKRHYRPRSNKNLTDSEIDPSSISSEIKESKGVHRTHSTPCFSKKVDVHSRLLKNRPASPLLVDCYSNNMHGLQTVKQEVKQQKIASVSAPSCVKDDVYVEDLESLSSDENLTDASRLLDDMSRKRFSEKYLSSKERKPLLLGETSRTFADILTNGGTQLSDQYQGLSKRSHGIYSKTHLPARKFSNPETNEHSKESCLISGTFDHDRQESKLLDSDLEELNKELDNIESQLNKHEKSLVRSEKHMSKLEHRMVYIESFALGKESEYL